MTTLQERIGAICSCDISIFFGFDYTGGDHCLCISRQGAGFILADVVPLHISTKYQSVLESPVALLLEELKRLYHPISRRPANSISRRRLWRDLWWESCELEMTVILKKTVIMTVVPPVSELLLIGSNCVVSSSGTPASKLSLLPAT